MSEVELIVAGQRYTGWTSARVERAIDSVSAAFRLELTEHDPGTDEPWRFDPSDPAEIRFADETLVNGYIDAVDGRFTESTHTLSVRGRDRTADLVDSSAEVAQSEFTDVILTQLARRLVEPFGLSVSANVDVGEAFRQFKIEPGESGFEALERAARQRGVLLNSDRNGDLVITRPGARRADDALVQSENVLEARAGASHEKRFAKYICLGQRPGNDNITGKQTTGIRGEATDSGASDRHRVLVIIAEQATSPRDAKRRAQWEASSRAARSSSLTVTVQGWRQSTGALWREGMVVPVELPALRVTGELIAASVRYRFDDRGTRAEIELQRPDAFEPKPQIDDDSDDVAAAASASRFDTNWGRN
jgi:prophage tail gpP-like protein